LRVVNPIQKMLRKEEQRNRCNEKTEPINRRIKKWSGHTCKHGCHCHCPPLGKVCVE
jgi:hypothetical protein